MNLIREVGTVYIYKIFIRMSRGKILIYGRMIRILCVYSNTDIQIRCAQEFCYSSVYKTSPKTTGAKLFIAGCGRYRIRTSDFLLVRQAL